MSDQNYDSYGNQQQDSYPQQGYPQQQQGYQQYQQPGYQQYQQYQQPYQQYQQPYQQQYAYQQPGAYQPGMQGGYKPDSNLVWAILTTIFCCLPFGIVSIVYASKVDSLWAQGNYQGAQDASNKAKTWAIWAAVIGVVVLVIYLIMVFAAGASLWEISRYY